MMNTNKSSSFYLTSTSKRGRKTSIWFVCVMMISSQWFVRPVRSLSTRSTASLSSMLRNPSLLPEVDRRRPTFEVRNPADPDSLVGEVSVMDRSAAKSCIENSHKVLPSWRDGTTAAERSRLLTEWARLIQENKEDIATIMTMESGKPLQESRGEVTYGTSFLDFYAAEGVRPTGAGGGFLVPTPFAHAETGAPRGQLMAIQQAVGVTVSITPWNFPLSMMTRNVGPALAAGCTALVKPNERTPLTAIALQTLADQAGIPPGVLQLVTPDLDSLEEVGNELCTNTSVRKISFTGSTRVGKLLMKLSSDTVKRLTLELGGNAPFVVFDDANVDQAVGALMASKFRNAGQTCVCADRVLVHAAIHDEFVDKLAACVQEIRVGNGLDATTTMGPLITPEAVLAIHEKVEESLDQGASCVEGGEPLPRIGPNFYAPTILTNVSPDSRIWKTETFGPVAAICKFHTEEEALELANDSDVGLAAYFCTRDLERAFRFARSLECGMVGVNEGIISTAQAPFGGIKESGLGREGSSLGIAEFLETKYVFLNV